MSDGKSDSEKWKKRFKQPSIPSAESKIDLDKLPIPTDEEINKNLKRVMALIRASQENPKQAIILDLDSLRIHFFNDVITFGQTELLEHFLRKYQLKDGEEFSRLVYGDKVDVPNDAMLSPITYAEASLEHNNTPGTYVNYYVTAKIVQALQLLKDQGITYNVSEGIIDPNLDLAQANMDISMNRARLKPELAAFFAKKTGTDGNHLAEEFIRDVERLVDVEANKIMAPLLGNTPGAQ